MPAAAFGQDDEVIEAVPLKVGFETFGQDDEVVSFGADDAEGPSGVLARAGNAAKAFAQGITESTGQSISGAARTADTIKEGTLLTSQQVGSERPTLRQRRRAFVEAMDDPRYFSALTEAGDDPALMSRAESLFGPKAKLDLIRAPIDAGNRMAKDESLAQGERLNDSPTFQFGQHVAEAGRELYPTDETLDALPESKVTRSLGSTLPSVALGLVPGVGLPAAVSQYAFSQSEDMAQEAIDAGRPDLATQAATAGLFIGALSEATLGATARLRSILKNPTKIKAMEGWAAANPIKAATIAIGVREAGQEGVEQVMQNLTASHLVGYDPDRPWHRNVLEAAVLGGVGGALFGSGGALVTRAGKPKADPKADEAEALKEFNLALDDLQAEPPEAAAPEPVKLDVTVTEDQPAAAVQAPGPVQMLPAFEPERLTPEQVMSREAANAMAELRALKAGKQIPKSEVRSPNSEERPAATIEPPTAPAVAAPTAALEPVLRRLREEGLTAENARLVAGGGDVVGAVESQMRRFDPGPERHQEARVMGIVTAINRINEILGKPGDLTGAEYVKQKKQRELAALANLEAAPEPTGKESLQVAPSASQRLSGSNTRRPTLGPREDGVPDVLDAIAELGGIRAPQEEPTALAKAKADVRAAWGDMQTLGIMPDPQRDAEKAFAFYKALYKLAKALAAQGVKSATEMAAKMNLKLNAVVQAAWDDAVAGKAKTNPLQLDPSATTEFLENLRERKFSQRFADDDRIDPAIREATGNATYQAIPNEITVTQALGIIQEQGIDAAVAMLKDEQNRAVSDRERVALGQSIILKSNHEYAQTKNEVALDRAVDVAEWLTEYGTRLGQGVQAFAIWSRLTPDGLVRAYVRAVRDSRPQRPGVPPTADPATKKKVHQLATSALKKPVGFQRDEALVDVLAHIARAKGIRKMDVATALWYANILSGWTTQVRNLGGNLSHLLAESFAHAATRPQHLPAILAGLYNGALRGVFDAAPILRTGKVTGTRVGKLDAPPVLELIKFNGAAYPLNAWKYVFRVMAATDMVFFRSAEEMRARFLARELVRTEKLSGAALAKRMAELLHNTPALRARAEQQATQEGLKGNPWRRRVAEIIEQNRPAELVQSAADYGRYATYNQDPDGVLGAIAQGINSISRRFPPMRLVVPFTRVVANVTNNGLNYTPWGYRRLFPSAFMDENWMKDDAAPVEYQLQAARATLGTLALVALYALAAQHWDDEDPPFMLTANGPQDPDARRQLRETGWEPYTVKIGDRYWSYKETPLHLVMATLGSLLDAQRYKKLDEADAMTRAWYALKQVGSVTINQSFLRSLGEFFDGLSDDRVPRSGANFSGLARTSSSMLVPNLVKQIDKLYDPTLYDAGTVQGALLRDLPIARRGLDPALNVLGETIKVDKNPFYSVERPDPLWTLIGRRQLWIPTPSKTMMIGDRPITPEEYRALIASSGPAIRRRLEILQPFMEAVPRELAQDRIETITREERASARRRLGLRQ